MDTELGDRSLAPMRGSIQDVTHQRALALDGCQEPPVSRMLLESTVWKVAEGIAVSTPKLLNLHKQLRPGLDFDYAHHDGRRVAEAKELVEKSAEPAGGDDALRIADGASGIQRDLHCPEIPDKLFRSSSIRSVGRYMSGAPAAVA